MRIAPTPGLALPQKFPKLYADAFMKIFFSYLFVRLLVPFSVCLFACGVIWIMADLYGNVDDFITHKANLGLVLHFYLLQIPSMLVQVLPAALLFSTLWTLLSLNRRSELVAFQSGGISPIILFSPFYIFALIWVGVLAYDLSGPAAESQVTRERLIGEVRGQDSKKNIFHNLPYIDPINRRVWFFQTLDTGKGIANGVEILQRDANQKDVVKYFAKSAVWLNNKWQLSSVMEITFGPDGTVLAQKTYDEKELDIPTPPKQLSLISTPPDQLTLKQLTAYIQNSTSSQEYLAKYRTEWWYRVLHPLTLIVLVIFALAQGTRTDRRNAIGGVVGAIIVLMLYMMVMNVFLAAGHFNRLPPVVAVASTEVIFGVIGLSLLAIRNSWIWQLKDLVKRWNKPSAPKPAAA